MKRYFYFLLFFFVFSFTASAQSWQWAKQTGTTYNDNSLSITVDVVNNYYTCGRFNNTGIVIKYNSNGDTLWTKNLGVSLSSVCYDRKGHILVTGMSSFLPEYLLTKIDTNGTTLWTKQNNKASMGTS